MMMGVFSLDPIDAIWKIMDFDKTQNCLDKSFAKPTTQGRFFYEEGDLIEIFVISTYY